MSADAVVMLQFWSVFEFLTFHLSVPSLKHFLVKAVDILSEISLLAAYLRTPTQLRYVLKCKCASLPPGDLQCEAWVSTG